MDSIDYIKSNHYPATTLTESPQTDSLALPLNISHPPSTSSHNVISLGVYPNEVNRTSARRCLDHDETNLCNELNLAASLNNLALSLFANVSSLDDDWNIRYPTCTEELCVSELEEVYDGSFVLWLFGEVLLAHFFRDKSPELVILVLFNGKWFQESAHLVQIDDWLPEVVFLTMEVSHSDFSEISRMIFVHVYTVVVLTSSQTSTTWVFPVLADATVTGRHMASTSNLLANMIILKGSMMTDCFLVFVFLVGILACGRCEDGVICSGI
jgi:hypothetical protein